MSEVTAHTTASGTPPVKSFMTAGPTLHYSHTNVLWLWFLTVLVYVATCLFWHAIVIGGTFSIGPLEFADTDLIRLGQYAMAPISIYEYPWQIVVLGISMGIMAVIPLLVSQLLSFRYSVAMVLALMFIAKLYLFGIFVLISCIAVACRPLRFRSRFISLALCMAPQLIYWAVWGGAETTDPVRWGFSFAPWIYAWLSGLAMAGLTLGIGHFTRYKPGLNWLISFLFLGIAFGVFQRHIGFAELDYQRYIAQRDPDDVVEFQDQSISEALDKVLADPSERSRLAGQFFELNDEAGLRLKLKENIQDMLAYNNRWPGWFRKKIPDRLQYQIRQTTLMFEYENYISRWANNRKRLPTVMYFRSILSEMRPDVRAIVDEEMLRFYSDYPFPDNNSDWRDLFESFPESPESIEARWRIAMAEAGSGNFDLAKEICQSALVMIAKAKIELTDSRAHELSSIFAAFRKPAPTVMTPFKFYDLQNRFHKLLFLIRVENRGDNKESFNRLAEFVMLNPYDELSYESGLNGLLEKMPPDDGLIDNVLLAKAMLIDDIHRRLQAMEELAKQYPERDGGGQAQYEQGMIKIKLWKNADNSEEKKKKLLVDSHTILNDLIKRHPDSFFSKQAAETLKTLPQPQ